MNEAGTLYCFYDLKANPNSFDVGKFLVLADLERRLRNLARIHVVVVPDDGGWARADDMHTPGAQEWRARNILVPSIRQLPSLCGYTVCSSRAQAQAIEDRAAEIFPSGHSTAAPVSRHEWADIGVKAHHPRPTLRASARARHYARQWIDSRAAGRKVVSMTLREMDLSPGRNSNLDAWVGFARGLDRRTYLPVIIRDTDRAFDLPSAVFEGIDIFNAAALNFDLRAGFYEECYVNMLVANGPAEFCILNTAVSYIYFMILRFERDGSLVQYQPFYGLAPRSNYYSAGPHQHVVWELDSRDALERSFAHAVDVLEGQAEEVAEFRKRDAFPPTRQPILTTLTAFADGGVMRQFGELLCELEANLSSGDPFFAVSEEKLFSIVKMMINCREFARANSYIELVIASGIGGPRWIEISADLLVLLGDLAGAISAYRSLLAESPDYLPVETKLARVLAATGGQEEAERILRACVERGVTEPAVFGALSDILRDKGEIRESARFGLLALRGI